MNYSRDKLCEYILDRNYVSINKEVIGINGVNILSINFEQLVYDTKFIDMYSDIVNGELKSVYTNNILVFKDTNILIPNLILSWKYNLNFGIISSNPCNKNTKRLDLFKDSLNDRDNFAFPIIKYPDTETQKNKYYNWIKFITTKYKPKNVAIIVFFDVNISEEVTELKNNFINDVLELSGSDVNIFFKTIINLEGFFDYTKNVIDSAIYNKITLFITHSANLNQGDYLVVNESINKYLELKKLKKSKVCVSLESITNVEELIKFTNLIGPYIHSIKINSNHIFNINILTGLRRLADHHKFLILDDKRLEVGTKKDLSFLSELVKYVDVVTLKFRRAAFDLTSILDKVLEIKPFFGIAFVYDDNIEDTMKYYTKYMLGIIGENKLSKQYLSLIDYSELKSDISLLKQTSMILLGNEIYQERNPVEILQKINTI